MTAKLRAKNKGLAFDITETSFEIPVYCPILGIELKRTPIKASDCSPSLDRIDNSKGYIEGNVRVISRRANLLKSNMTYEECVLILKDLKSRIN